MLFENACIKLKYFVRVTFEVSDFIIENKRRWRGNCDGSSSYVVPLVEQAINGGY